MGQKVLGPVLELGLDHGHTPFTLVYQLLCTAKFSLSSESHRAARDERTARGRSPYAMSTGSKEGHELYRPTTSRGVGHR